MDLKLVIIMACAHVAVEGFIIELPVINERKDNGNTLQADMNAAFFRTRSTPAHLKVEDSQRRRDTKNAFSWAKNADLASDKGLSEDIIAFVIKKNPLMDLLKRGTSGTGISTHRGTVPVERKPFPHADPSRSRRETSTSIYENPDVQNVLKEYMKIKSSSGVVFYIPRWG